MQAGQYIIPAADYFADAGSDVPTLNSSIARILLSESPRHAWEAHPALNPAYVRKEKKEFDLGNAVHAYLLEDDTTAFAIVDAPAWRTDASKAARALARKAGQIPLLAHEFESVKTMAEAVRVQLARLEDGIPFVHGAAEQTLRWSEDGVECRARLDWLSSDRRNIWDLKSTAASANPDAFGRALFNSGYDVQAGMYLRGVKSLFGIEAEFRFVVVEVESPYAVSVIGLAPDALALADRKVSRAINLWRECLASGQWPGYPTRTCFVEAPPWEMAKFETGEFSEKSIVLEDAP